MEIDMREFIRDNWDNYKYDWPWIPKEGRNVPELTPEIEIDILSRALIKSLGYMSDMCKEILDGSEYCPEYFVNSPHPCCECKLYWLIGQGTEDYVRQMKKRTVGVPKEAEQ